MSGARPRWSTPTTPDCAAPVVRIGCERRCPRPGQPAFSNRSRVLRRRTLPLRAELHPSRPRHGATARRRSPSRPSPPRQPAGAVGPRAAGRSPRAPTEAKATPRARTQPPLRAAARTPRPAAGTPLAPVEPARHRLTATQLSTIHKAQCPATPHHQSARSPARAVRPVARRSSPPCPLPPALGARQQDAGQGTTGRGQRREPESPSSARPPIRPHSHGDIAARADGKGSYGVLPPFGCRICSAAEVGN